jgi:hypothetical protein
LAEPLNDRLLLGGVNTSETRIDTGGEGDPWQSTEFKAPTSLPS